MLRAAANRRSVLLTDRIDSIEVSHSTLPFEEKDNAHRAVTNFMGLSIAFSTRRPPKCRAGWRGKLKGTALRNISKRSRT